MNPEAAAAIQIAEKHLPGTPPEKRMALAKDILEAIRIHAETMAIDAIKQVAENPQLWRQ